MKASGEGFSESVSGNTNRLQIVFDAEDNASEKDDEPSLPTDWSVDLSISNCGDDPFIPVGPGVVVYPDYGNSYTLKVEYEYIEYGEVEEEEE